MGKKKSGDIQEQGFLGKRTTASAKALKSGTKIEPVRPESGEE